jgi:hypothetical protein
VVLDGWDMRIVLVFPYALTDMRWYTHGKNSTGVIAYLKITRLINQCTDASLTPYNTLIEYFQAGTILL